MLKLKTKWFNKWAKKNLVTDEALLKTIEDLSNNLGVVDLGSGLYKVRTAKTGRGKSGSFRSMVVYREGELVIFVYAFSKTEKDNLTSNELKYFKTLAKDLLLIDRLKYEEMIEAGSFINIKQGN